MSNNSLLRRLSGHYPRIITMCLALGLSACTQSYVVLLEDDDGSLGKVVVNTAAGTTVLQHQHDALDMDAEAGRIFTAGEQQIQEDFGAALAASPQKPASFYLYFDGGTTNLSPESVKEIPNIIAEIKRRPAADISVIGHTDTVGDDKVNAKLSLQRAKSVAAMFSAVQLNPERITVDSHGEKNLLVPTPDNTDEAKNRRVEVTVR
jgi:peptidoglycan-associated lipoprotein